MGKDKEKQQEPGQKPSPKLEEQRKKLAEGTTKPIPTSADNTPEEKAELDKSINKKTKALEEARKKLEALKKEIKEAVEAEKKAKNAEKETKKAEADKTIAERLKKQKEINDVDTAIAKAQKDLEATEEWKVLGKAKEKREKIGPLPKISKTKGPRKPRDPNAPPSTSSFGLERDHDLPWSEKKKELLTTLKNAGATKATSACSTAEVVERSTLVGRDVRHYAYHAKAGGLVDVAEMDGKRGYCFFITEAGQKELASHKD